MKLIRLTGGDCAGDNCPAVYLSEAGELVVQGYALDQDTRAELHSMAAGEDAIRISPELLVSAAEKYLSRHGEGR